MSSLSTASDTLEHILRENRFCRHGPPFRRVVEVADGPCPGSYELALARGEGPMLEHFGLRFRSYRDHDYLPFVTCDGELEYDAHDAHAALFIARNLSTGLLHGAARLAFDVGGRLPMDGYYSLDGFRRRIGWHDSRQVLAEFSRLISHPTGQKALNRELVRAVFGFAVRSGVDYLLGAGRVDIRHYYDKWGFQDVEPGREILLAKGERVLALYPHYMHVTEIRWDRI